MKVRVREKRAAQPMLPCSDIPCQCSHQCSQCSHAPLRPTLRQARRLLAEYWVKRQSFRIERGGGRGEGGGSERSGARVSQTGLEREGEGARGPPVSKQVAWDPCDSDKTRMPYLNSSMSLKRRPGAGCAPPMTMPD